jgi:phosphoenolpyruvate carboxylase
MQWCDFDHQHEQHDSDEKENSIGNETAATIQSLFRYDHSYHHYRRRRRRRRCRSEQIDPIDVLVQNEKKKPNRKGRNKMDK